MSVPNINLLRSKFRGCMLGALAGDCCGAPFEGDTFTTGAKLVLQRYFDTLEGPYFKAPAKKYTADSSMSKCVAQWLVEQSPHGLDKEEPDGVMLARTLAKEFFTDPQRGYGENVIVVFNKLRASKFTDPYQPASEPANLTGSSDNGAAVRVMPLALAYWQQPERMLTEAYNATRLTHTHSEGLLGALLQCAALRLCLLQEPGQGARPPAGFLAELELQLAAAERETQRDGDGLGLAPSESALYRKQLRAVAALCERSRVEPTDDEVLDRLGHSTRALYSVPTAIYCFLRAGEHPGDGGPMRRALEYAVSLGGDTDTIAAMTGALAGAYHGRDCLSDSLIRHCEGAPLFEQLADALLKFSNTAT